MSKYTTTSTIECEIDGKMTMVTVSHPGVSDLRRQAIRRCLDAGCELVPDIDELPTWLHAIPSQAQTSLFTLKPELFKFYKLRVPQGATITSTDWTMLPQLQELRHLSISSTKLAPQDVVNMRCLEQLEILVLHTPVVNDKFCFSFPRMKCIRMIDVMGTSVTTVGVQALQDACPNAKIYSDCDMTN
jgi:hypothetical protein